MCKLYLEKYVYIYIYVKTMKKKVLDLKNNKEKNI